MAATPQTFANHTRWHAPFHFFLVPVMILNVIWSIVQLVRHPGWDRAEWVLVSLALVVLAALVRLNPLRAQDRLIRLEEQLRYQRLLPAAWPRGRRTVARTVFAAFASYAELEGSQSRSAESFQSRDIKRRSVVASRHVPL